MRYQWLLLLVLAGGSCATRPNVRPPVPTQYVFVETLPDHALICVRRDPFRAELACLSLGEFRYTLRHMKRASLSWPTADEEEQAPRPDRDLSPPIHQQR
jgi:hypothetical protein